MKKCLKCNVLFQLDDRRRCLYCDALLITVTKNETFDQTAGGVSIHSFIQGKTKAQVVDHMQYLVCCYFKARTFPFMYTFSRNELKQGKGFKRFFVQPFNVTFMLKLPWIFINIVDSLIFHLIYGGYCESCGWKYVKPWGSSKGTHTPQQCEYNREYTAIMNEILSGNIAQTEEDFKRRAIDKMKNEERSAYYDLCSRKRKAEVAMDIISIWLSVVILTAFVVLSVKPLMTLLIEWIPNNLM